MGQTHSNDGHCGGIVPLHVDPRGYALTKVHKIPARKDLFDMYPEYTKEMACHDLVSYRQTGRPAYALPKYHKILRKGFFGSDLRDPRHYVFQRVYGLRREEIANIDRHPGYYTRDMAIQELQWQQARKRDPHMPPFKYDLSRRIRFTNTEHGHVYKPGAKGYKHGFSYSVHGPDFTMPTPSDPRQGKATKANVERAAYERGLAHGRKEAADWSAVHLPSAPPPPPHEPSQHKPSISMSPSHVSSLSHSTPSLTTATIPKRPSADFSVGSGFHLKLEPSASASPSKKRKVHAHDEPFVFKSPASSDKLYMQRHVSTRKPPRSR